MTGDDLLFRNALCPGGTDVILPDDLQHGERVIRASWVMGPMPAAMMGKTKLFHPSAPDGGNHPSLSANTSIKMTATRKPGMAFIITANVVVA